MRTWKAVLGIGAACAACCTVPLVGSVAAWTVGTSALAAAGSALLACADEFAPLGAVLSALAGLAGAAVWWVRRQRRGGPPENDESSAHARCQFDPAAPPALDPPSRAACGCKPGNCT